MLGRWCLVGSDGGELKQIPFGNDKQEMRRLGQGADLEDLLAVLFYFCWAHAGDFLELVGGDWAGVGNGAQSAVVQHDEGRHAQLFGDGGAPGFQGLFQLLGGWA